MTLMRENSAGHGSWHSDSNEWMSCLCVCPGILCMIALNCIVLCVQCVTAVHTRQLGKSHSWLEDLTLHPYPSRRCLFWWSEKLFYLQMQPFLYWQASSLLSFSLQTCYGLQITPPEVQSLSQTLASLTASHIQTEWQIPLGLALKGWGLMSVVWR